jgi:hypothetical protein
MKAKFVNEKFVEKSDPIKDMSIGGIKLSDLIKPYFEKMYTNDLSIDEIIKEWYKYLSELLNGKTINAMLQRYPSMTVKRGTIKVKNVIKSEYESYFVKGEDGGRYRISPDVIMYILD